MEHARVPDLPTRVALGEVQGSFRAILRTFSSGVAVLQARRQLQTWLKSYDPKGNGLRFIFNPEEVYTSAVLALKTFADELAPLFGRDTARQAAIREIARIDCLREKLYKEAS